MFFYIIFVFFCVFMWEWMWGVDVCKQIFVYMYVEASGQAQVSVLRNAIYRFGFSLVVYWFGGGSLSLRKGLSLDYNLPIRLYWLARKHQCLLLPPGSTQLYPTTPIHVILLKIRFFINTKYRLGCGGACL